VRVLEGQASFRHSGRLRGTDRLPANHSVSDTPPRNRRRYDRVVFAADLEHADDVGCRSCAARGPRAGIVDLGGSSLPDADLEGDQASSRVSRAFQTVPKAPLPAWPELKLADPVEGGRRLADGLVIDDAEVCQESQRMSERPSLASTICRPHWDSARAPESTAWRSPKARAHRARHRDKPRRL